MPPTVPGTSRFRRRGGRYHAGGWPRVADRAGRCERGALPHDEAAGSPGADTPLQVAEIERYWPDIDGLALRDMVTSGAIGQGAPSGTFFDYAPLHLLTTATLAHLRTLYPQGQVDAQRFRPNLVIAVPEEVRGFAENSWVGHTLQIGGDVRLRISNPVPRCVVPTLPQGELAADIGILRAVAQHNRPPVPALDGQRLPCLGVYASVERDGVICQGDAVRIAGAN